MRKWIVISLGVALAAVAGLALWSNPTPVEAQSPVIAGSGKCEQCHKSAYDNWRQTLHSRMIGKAPDAIIPAWDASKTWVPKEDILFTIGSKYRQGYVTKKFEVLNIYWDTVKNEWFGSPGGVLRDWKSGCADCHTTGYNPASRTFAEIGITCESCHGSGLDHVTRGARMDKTLAVDSATCNRCHVRKVAGREPPLTDMAEWWPDGHAKDHRMQGNEWKMSPHARSKQGMREDYCMTCKAPADVRFPPTYGPKATFETTRFSIECAVCHTPHNTGVPRTSQLRIAGSELCSQCHNTGSGPPRQAGAAPKRADKEIFEGVGGFGVTAPMPSPMNMVACYECHMVQTGSSGGRWRNIASHNLNVIEPAKAARGQPDSCTTCHANQGEAMQRVIESRQGDVKALLTSLKARMEVVKPTLGRWDPGKGTTAAQKAFDEAFTNVGIVASDGSKGFHNFPFAMALLKAADQRLGPTPPAAAGPAAPAAGAPAGLPRTGDPMLPAAIGLSAITAISAIGAGLALRRRKRAKD
ncbi:MAG: ammonia-forming cytochrome c nitrite reductase subunit c552 [Chloroflexi bacterium]|nr:ammonia-forming cytochrome c nitrite reductase subunit c552 [Chloroflexota bacterium]